MEISLLVGRNWLEGTLLFCNMLVNQFKSSNMAQNFSIIEKLITEPAGYSSSKHKRLVLLAVSSGRTKSSDGIRGPFRISTTCMLGKLKWWKLKKNNFSAKCKNAWKGWMSTLYCRIQVTIINSNGRNRFKTQTYAHLPSASVNEMVLPNRQLVKTFSDQNNWIVF